MAGKWLPQSMRKRMRHPVNEEGAVLVESALVLMVFLMLIFGIMEAGRLVEVRNAVTEAAREGARFAVSPLHDSQHGTWTLPSSGEISLQTKQFLAAAGIDATNASITINSQYPFPGDSTTMCTQVSISIPYQVLTPIAPFGGITLKAQSVMRNETSN
jgi:Flp pilus assembly protein TadG